MIVISQTYLVCFSCNTTSLRTQCALLERYENNETRSRLSFVKIEWPPYIKLSQHKSNLPTHTACLRRIRRHSFERFDFNTWKAAYIKAQEPGAFACLYLPIFDRDIPLGIAFSPYGYDITSAVIFTWKSNKKWLTLFERNRAVFSTVHIYCMFAQYATKHSYYC